MQDNSSSVIPSSNLSTPSIVNPLTSTHNDIHSDVKLPLEGNFSSQSHFEGSSIWTKKLTTNMLSQKAKIFSNIQLLDKEDQKALVFPFLNNYRSTVKSGTFGTASPIMTRKAKQITHLFSNALDFSSCHLKIQDAQLDEQKIKTEFRSNNEVPTGLQPSFPICSNTKIASLLVNLSNNLKRTYEKGPNFGPLERAHMEWMGDNEITTNRAAYIRFRKLSMYRNFVYQGSSAAMRYTLINEFLMRKGLYPKKETKSFIPKIPEVLNETFKDAVSTCENWYKQGQSLAMGLLKRQYNPEDKDSQKNETTISVPGLEGQTITIDWDKALHHALRSHAIAQVLGIPPQVLFLSGFAAIDIRQIVMSNDLDNIEKLIFVAQIVLKTLIKIIVVIGTQLFTSGLLGLGGIDIISVPFGVHGERYLEKQLTNRVFGAIDKHFDSIKTTTDAIVDC